MEKKNNYRPDLASVKLIHPASFEKRPDTSRVEPQIEVQARLHALEIDAATTIGHNRHEAGGHVYSRSSDDRYAVELEWHETHGQHADGKSSLLTLHVQGFEENNPIIHYDGGWIVQPATDAAWDILAVCEERYGPLAEKMHELPDRPRLSSDDRATRIQAAKEVREAEESRELDDPAHEI